MVGLLLLRFLSIVSECAARSYVLRCSVPGTRGYGILRYSLYRAPFGYWRPEHEWDSETKYLKYKQNIEGNSKFRI